MLACTGRSSVMERFKDIEHKVIIQDGEEGFHDITPCKVETFPEVRQGTFR